jgi:hypothetical protein
LFRWPPQDVQSQLSLFSTLHVHGISDMTSNGFSFIFFCKTHIGSLLLPLSKSILVEEKDQEEVETRCGDKGRIGWKKI